MAFSLFLNSFTGSDKNTFNPTTIIIKPATKVIMNLSSLIKLIITVNPKPDKNANNVSALASPSPEKNPESQPLLIVLLISTIPIGPGGIDTASPRIIPLSSISIAVIIDHD